MKATAPGAAAWLRSLRPSSRPAALMMPSWYATPFAESLLFTASALEHLGMAFIAHKGTLLGALRLGGVLPWDDDADLFLVDAYAEDVSRLLGPLLQEHGFVLRFRSSGYYFSAYPRLAVPLHMGGLTEMGLMTRTGTDGDIHFDRHEPGRRLSEKELFPIRRIPFYGSHLPGPADSEAAVARMYGALAGPEVMGRFKAPALAAEAVAFWRTARPVDGPQDWEAISRRMRTRSRDPAFHLAQAACSAWYLANRSYWMAVDGLRRAAGGAR